jgi:hypothetical protein
MICTGPRRSQRWALRWRCRRYGGRRTRPSLADHGRLPGLRAPRIDRERCQRDLERAGVAERVETVIADAGYWHKKQMENLVSDGIQVLIPPDGGLREGTRPGWDGGTYDHMRRVLQSERGRALYRKRKQSIEPVFGQIKYNRRCDRFKRRGRAAVRPEWRLIAATHNLLKLHSHWIAAEPA